MTARLRLAIVWLLTSIAGYRDSMGAGKTSPLYVYGMKPEGQLVKVGEPNVADFVDKDVVLKSGVYGLPFGATIDEVVKWCVDNKMTVVDRTQADIDSEIGSSLLQIADCLDPNILADQPRFGSSQESWLASNSKSPAFEASLVRYIATSTDMIGPIERRLWYAQVWKCWQKLQWRKMPTYSYGGITYYLRPHAFDEYVVPKGGDRVFMCPYVAEIMTRKGVIALRPEDTSGKSGLLTINVWLGREPDGRFRSYGVIAAFSYGADEVRKTLLQKYGCALLMLRRGSRHTLYYEGQRQLTDEQESLYQSMCSRFRQRSMNALDFDPGDYDRGEWPVLTWGGNLFFAASLMMGDSSIVCDPQVGCMVVYGEPVKMHEMDWFYGSLPNTYDAMVRQAQHSLEASLHDAL